MPDTCVPTSTCVTGSTVPVAVTELRMVIWLMGAVSSRTFGPFEGRAISQMQTPAATTPAAMSRFRFFISSIIDLSGAAPLGGTRLCGLVNVARRKPLIDVEQFDTQQGEIFGLQDLLLCCRIFVLGRDQLDGVFHSDAELFAGQLVTLPGVFLLFAGREILGLADTASR